MVALRFLINAMNHVPVPLYEVLMNCSLLSYLALVGLSIGMCKDGLPLFFITLEYAIIFVNVSFSSHSFVGDASPKLLKVVLVE